MRRWIHHIVEVVVPPLALFVSVAAMWHLAVVVFKAPPYLVPGPLKVWDAVCQNAGELARATLLTALGALGGFFLSFLVGSLVSFVFAQSRWIQRAAYPYAIFLQTVPIVAIAPLIILWFRPGFQSVVVVSFIISVFPILTNGTAGLTSVNRDLLELFSVNRATRWQILWKLRFPYSVPYMVTGLKISSGLSVIGAIVGEFFAGYGTDRYGLGYVVILTSSQLKTAYLFAAILASTLLGLAIFGGVSLVGNWIVSRWHYAESST